MDKSIIASTPDTGYDLTRPSVMAIKSFKNTLLSTPDPTKVSSQSILHELDGGSYGSHLSAERSPDSVSYSNLANDDDEEEADIDEYMGSGDTRDTTNITGDKIMPSPPPPSFRNTIHAVSEFLESTKATEDVQIICAFGKLTFKALHVSLNDYGIAFIVKKDAFQFEPNLNTSLKIVYKDIEYTVVYAGGFFTFDKMPFTFVSFLNVTD